MRKALALTIVLGVAGAAVAQTAQHMPRGTATDIPNADIQALAKSMASMPGGGRYDPAETGGTAAAGPTQPRRLINILESG